MRCRAQLGLAVVVGVWIAPATALAETAPERPFELRWSAPAECPSDVYVASQVTRLAARAPEPALEVDANAWKDQSGRWRVALVTRMGGERGERIVDADTCDHAADATALILAMMIDPAGVRARLAAERPPPAAEAPPEPARAPAAPRPETPPDRARAANEPRERRGLVAAYGTMDGGALPHAAYGAGIAVGVRIPLDRGPSPVRLRAEGSFIVLPAQRAEMAGTSRAADVLLIAGALRAALVYGEVVEAGPSLGYELGSLAGEGIGVRRPDSGAALWQAAMVGAAVRWPARGPLALRASAELVVPFTRPAFAVADAVVHRPAGVGGRGTLGVDFSF